MCSYKVRFTKLYIIYKTNFINSDFFTLFLSRVGGFNKQVYILDNLFIKYCGADANFIFLVFWVFGARSFNI